MYNFATEACNVLNPCVTSIRHFSYFFSRLGLTDNDVVNFLEVGDQVYAMSDVAAVIRVDMATLGRQQKVITYPTIPQPHIPRKQNTVAK